MATVLTWTFTIVDTIDPWLNNAFPTGDAESNTNISFNVLDDSTGVVPSLIDAYFDGNLIFSGPSTFISPFDGPNSSFSSITVDGYDGYRVVLDRTQDFRFSDTHIVRVTARDAYGNLLDESFTFTIPETTINALYYADDYGLHRVFLSDLAGESQLAQEIVLAYPDIPTNSISFIDEQVLDEYFILTLSLQDDYGVRLYASERYLNTYADGYNCEQAQINSRGILYLINKTENRIESYHGVDFRSGNRAPDYIYDSTSTPALFNNSEILTLHLDESNGQTILYVGQAIGMTIINTVDTETTDGYSDGLENTGTSTTYSISGADYNIIGGTDPQVVDITTEGNIIMVATPDGITQIRNNRKLYHMTEENGFLPTNTVRKIKPI